MEEKTNYIIHVTHNDGDALGCAVLFQKFQQSVNTEVYTVFTAVGEAMLAIRSMLAEFKENGNIDTLSSIVISDTSVTNTEAEELVQLSEAYDFDIALYDHHPTNKLDEKYNWAHVTHKKYISAAKYMMENMNIDNDETSNTFYEFINDISRYDTWQWKDEPRLISTEDSVTLLLSQISIQDAFERVMSNFEEYGHPFSDAEETLIQASRNKIQNDIDKIVAKQNYRVIEYDGYVCATYISDSRYNNYVMNALLASDKDIDFVMSLLPAVRTISLRTTSNDIHLGSMMKRHYGGGGHAKAAGAKLTTEDFIKMLNNFYTVDYITPSLLKEAINQLTTDYHNKACGIMPKEEKAE